MKKFKTGDRIVRVVKGRSFCPIKFETTVTENYTYVDADGELISIIEDYWELAEDTSKHHVHHDLIIAWAKGAEIEYDSVHSVGWHLVDPPSWGKNMRYRVKPTPPPKTDKERIVELEARVAELESN